MRKNNNAWGGLVNPSGSPYYNLIQGTGGSLTTKVANLVVGQSYQLSGFVSNRPGFLPSAFEVRMDGAVILPKMIATANTFIPFGPITVQAKAITHTLGFYNVSDPGDRTVLLDGLLFK